MNSLGEFYLTRMKLFAVMILHGRTNSMRIGGEDVVSKQSCLSCHSTDYNDYDLPLCLVCAPWTNNGENPKSFGSLERITLLEFIHGENYQEIISRGMPDGDIAWKELLCSINASSIGDNGRFVNDTEEVLSLITHIQDVIDEYTEDLSRSENLALSYYSHFVDLDKSSILGDDEEKLLQFEIRNQNVTFRIVRMKGDEVPSHAYSFSKPLELHSNYYAEIVSINGSSVSFDYKDLEGCAEVLLLLEIHNRGIDDTVESYNRKCREIIDKLLSQHCELFTEESIQILPHSISILSELNRILSGKDDDLVRELLLCSLYTFENWKWIQNVLDPARVKSFQFLSQIMTDLGKRVTLYENGFSVDSLTGNRYQVNWTKFRTDHVFWFVTELFEDNSVCIEVEEEHDLPMGDILAVILLSLYDDIESSELIKTLNI